LSEYVGIEETQSEKENSREEDDYEPEINVRHQNGGQRGNKE